jgi:1-deoxy-D-xylulose-5-phosphate reductoisomerase
MGNPDMRIPIAHALAYPERFESGAEPLNIFSVKQMDFSEADLARFPCLRLAYEAIEAGGTMPTVLNAANEIAVEAFLNGRIGFVQIAETIERTMDAHSATGLASIEEVLKADLWGRERAREICRELVR